MSRPSRKPSVTNMLTSGATRARDISPDLPELHKLVKTGNLTNIQQYLDRPADQREDINVVDHKGRTALHHACLCPINTAEVVLLLLRRGAYVHAVTDKNYLTPLHCACVKSALDAIRLLVKYGADLNARTADGKTPFKMLPPTSENKKFVKAILRAPPQPKFSKKDKELLEACMTGNELKVLDLLDKFVDVNVFEEKSDLTALMIASRQGHEQIAHLLLLHCADVHKQDTGKNTALHWACARGNSNIVKMLTYYNASVNISDKDHNYTPMHWAAAKNHKDLVPILLKFNANPNLPDKDGMTPLHIACRLGHLSMVEELASHVEVQVNIEDAYGVRPLHIAVRRSDHKIVIALLKNGADPTAETLTNNTPLHDACEEPNPAIAKSLLENGAKNVVNTRNVDGNTPLHMAVLALRKGDSRLTKYILKTINVLIHFGASQNIKNGEEKIPLLCIDPNKGATEGTPENFVVKALVEAGVDMSIFQQGGSSRARTQQERIIFENLVQTISRQSASQVLPEGWRKVEQGGRILYIDPSGNATAVAPQSWMLVNDPRISEFSRTLDPNQGIPKPSLLSLQDVSCTYCTEILFKPVTVECGHNFCQPCLDILLRKNLPCGMCKKKIPKKDYAINTMFATIVERSFPERYAARIAEFRAMGNN